MTPMTIKEVQDYPLMKVEFPKMKLCNVLFLLLLLLLLLLLFLTLNNEYEIST